MITLKAKEITDINVSKYGILFNLGEEGIKTGNTNHDDGDDWWSNDTAFPVIDTTGRLGYGMGKKQPFVLDKMERHSHTQEAQFTAGQNIIICLAEYKGEKPRAEDVVPVILRSGYALTLYRDIWHSAAHGIDSDAASYWMADVFDGEPTYWEELEGGPVLITG